MGGQRKLHNELHNLHSSPDVISVNKSRRIIWAEHVQHMAEKRNVYIGFWLQNRREETTSKTDVRGILGILGK
jgi:hypothetical protein